MEMLENKVDKSWKKMAAMIAAGTILALSTAGCYHTDRYRPYRPEPTYDKYHARPVHRYAPPHENVVKHKYAPPHENVVKHRYGPRESKPRQR